MERKLAVGETLSFVFSFAARRLGLFFRLAWLPLLLSVGGTAVIFTALGTGFFQAAAIGADPYANADWGRIALGYALSLLGLLAFVPAYVVLTRAAAGGYEPPRGLFAGLRFGGREGRVIGAAVLWFLLFMAIYFGITIVSTLLIGGISAALIGTGDGGGFVLIGILGFLMFLAIFGFVIFFSVRSLLFIPMAATENRIALGDAWAATKGNFWRLFAVGLVLYLAVFGLYVAFAAVAGVVIGLLGQSAMVPAAIILGLLAIPAYAFLYLLFIAYPARAAGVLRPMSETQAAEVFA